MPSLQHFIFPVIVASALVGCVQPPMATGAPDGTLSSNLTGSTWLAKSLAVPGRSPLSAPQLNFLSTTRVGGHGGCNAFGGDLTVSGSTVRVGPVAATRKLCDARVMALETQFFRALEALDGLRLEGESTLALLDDKAAVVLRLTRGQ